MSQFAFYVMAVIEPQAQASSDEPGGAEATLVGQGSLRFDTDGGLLSVTPADAFDIHFRGASDSEQVGFNFGSAKDAGGDGRSGFTQYALKSSITHQSSQ